jgi:outer membrane protein insertion porin family
MKVVVAILSLVFVGDSARIVDVQIRGNRRIPAETIKYNIRTKAGDEITAEAIRRDVKILYGLGYFDDIRVDAEDDERGATVVFVVKEKPLIRSIEFAGANSITKSEILEKLKERKVSLGQESPYDVARAKRAEAVIKAMLAEKGHQESSVEVFTEDIPPNSVKVTFKIDEGPKIRIQKIAIEGNHVFSDATLKRTMKLIKETSPLTLFNGKDSYYDLKLADDLTRMRILYADNGYLRVNILEPIVEARPTRVYRTLPLVKVPFPFGVPLPFWTKKVNRFYVTIKIEENDQYRLGDVKVSGAATVNESLVRAVLGLVPGGVYNESQLRRGFENLKKIYGTRGYINFTAVPGQDLDEKSKIVNLTINVDEDRQFMVNRIEFTGNTTTRDKVIRREVMVSEGQVFNSSLWDMSVLRLNQLGYFEEIKTEDAEIKPHPTEPKVDVNLKVKEKGRNSIGFNGGVSGIGGSFLGLNYSTNNFLGLGENLAVTLQGGTRQSQYQFSFTEPYLFNRPISTGFSLFSTSLRYDEARDVYGLNPQNLSGLGLDNRLNFEQHHAGFNLSVSYPVRIFQRLGLTYQFDNSQTTAINPATDEFFKGIAARDQENFVSSAAGNYSTYRSRRLTPTYTVNSVNNPYTPTRGYSFTASLEFTGGLLGGNVNFYRPSIDYRFYRPMNHGRNTLAMRFQTAYVQGFKNVTVPLHERFFMGGDFDIRGFDFRSISPISFITRTVSGVDAYTGKTVKQKIDDVAYIGGDTQAVFNLEYRIPLAGPITLAPFMDAGNAWVLKKRSLLRQVTDSAGNRILEGVQFLPGTNSGLRASAGAELQVIMPVINAPFRLVFAVNPSRINRTFKGPVTGLPLTIREPLHEFKFTVGRTF